jgi:hypothetical protein
LKLLHQQQWEWGLLAAPGLWQEPAVEQLWSSWVLLSWVLLLWVLLSLVLLSLVLLLWVLLLWVLLLWV